MPLTVDMRSQTLCRYVLGAYVEYMSVYVLRYVEVLDGMAGHIDSSMVIARQCSTPPAKYSEEKVNTDQRKV